MENGPQKGLYTPSLEHDACGIGFVANINGAQSAATISDALTMLENMEHRGGRGSSPQTGDGAGIIFQLPHSFFHSEAKKLGFSLPKIFGVGMIFFPQDQKVRNQCRKVLTQSIREMGLDLIGFRVVPVDHKIPGPGAAEVEPVIEQVFVQPTDDSLFIGKSFERKLFILRNYVSHQIEKFDRSFYIPSFSSRTIVYKGQLRTDQVRKYFYDLQNPDMQSGLAIVHSRFSTNTFPNWKLAQPFRYIAHNGEINTIRGNVNKMKSKEALFQNSRYSKEDLKKLLPITNPEFSDSANLDALVEMLVLSGRSLPHVMMMLVPEAWQDNRLMDPQRKAFYKYHASMMEPWDGPAALVFTDGKRVGATLDRNGLRPLRYYITRCGRVILSSEAGSLPVDPKSIIEKGRITPGKMMMVDLEKGRVMGDDIVKRMAYEGKPYYKWIIQNRVKLRLEPEPQGFQQNFDAETLRQRQQAFGFSEEDIKVLLPPMAINGYEALGSMGDDTPLAVLSTSSRHISDYFKQHFAQVSNPPIDPIRERLVMSLFTRVGSGRNVLRESAAHTKQVHISHPVLSNQDLEKLRRMRGKGFDHITIRCVFNADGKPGRLEEALQRICNDAEVASRAGIKILILSNKNVSVTEAPIPSMIATGAVHHHLVDRKIRIQAGILVEGGDIWEVHHFATVIGYGASAINPFMAIETLSTLNTEGKLGAVLPEEKVFSNYQKAIGNGLLKVMSKMGISTLQSYQSAQIFEALGIGPEVIEKCFKGTISRIDGLTFDDLANEVLIRHQMAFKNEVDRLPIGGIYQWKRKGERHMFNPETIHALQHSTRTNNFELYKEYASKVNDQTQKSLTLRGLMEFRKRAPISIDEVEPIEGILKRFVSGAMSFGSISFEAHTTLAIAMNRIGGKSNSGEGGEDSIRYELLPNGDSMRSATKQVASGRFGVTSYYLANADELQIKMAQGAKPGEGGQLPGYKVDEWIGRVRHSTPGVGLISPPPHHDIYSIEDLAQLIFDLKNSNRQARVNVKLVSQAGVGTVAAGVAKAKADAILISGADGGTGASPLSSVRHAGLPWELGLSEAHQTLVKNNLRSRVTVQTDGQIRTGRDIAIATLLGAEEWGVATAALVVEGCIMMRKCHLNTCPVGIATQDPELRKLFSGNPDHVVNFFTFLAQDLREVMAELGFKTINEMVGRADVLRMREEKNHWKLKRLDLSPILFRETPREHVAVFKQMEQDFELEKVLDWKLVEAARPALEEGLPSTGKFSIRNIDRAVGALLSNEVSKKYKGEGLPEDTIKFKFKGSAGQSFGAFVAPGVTFELEGEANDYFGKGLSGGKLIVYPDKESSFKPEDNMIVGNVSFYGATSGEAYIRGQAGERFCVRNSGVKAVVEAVGDHACEYMTGGRVLVLGPTGRNFAAGMSGGIAYIFNPEKAFEKLVNKEMIELEELEEEDKTEVHEMLSKHFEYTGSDPAEWILANWKVAKELFVKVMPRDFKAVLEKQKAKNELEAVTI